MSKFFHIIDSFSSGEISPKMRGRVDLEQYDNGARTLQNFTIDPHGGITRRPGTEYIADTKDESVISRLIPFEFSTTQAYIIEVGNLYLRFYRNQGQILDSETITNGTFGSDITGWTDTSVGAGAIAHNAGNSSMDVTADAGVDYGKAEQSLTLGTNQYTLTLDVVSQTLTYNIGTTSGASDIATGTVTAGTGKTFTFTPAVHGAVFISLENRNASTTLEVDNISIDTPIYQIDTPYTTAQIPDLQFAQSADVMYLVHNSHEVMKLSRTGHDDWTLTEVTFTDGPYYDSEHATYSGSGSAITLNPSGNSGSVTIVASSALFVSTDVGRLIRYRGLTSEVWGYATITAFGSTTSITATINVDFITNPASLEWQLGAFSDTTGHPGTVTFHEQRLVFAGTSDQPQTLWGSNSGEFENFSPDDGTSSSTVTDTHSYTFTIGSEKANVIHWLSSRANLFIGTSGPVFVAQASTNNEAITPSNINIKPTVNSSSKKNLPVNAQNATIFIQFFEKKLLELAFFFEEDNFRAADLTLLSEHITSTGIKEMALQEEPDQIIWCVTNDGTLIGLTYLRDQKIVGWHTHVVGGTSVLVESVASIPGVTSDEVWVIVKRTINSLTTRYVERITDEFAGVKVDAFYVDSGLTFTATTTKTITGITAANPAVVTSTSHGLSNGNWVRITGVVGMTEVNNKNFKIQNVATNTFELLNENSTSYTAYSSAGSALVLATTISGLDHLEAETVTLLADGATHPDVVVTSGAITLNRAVEVAHIGLSYTSLVETNTLEFKGPVGTIQGSIGRVYRSAIRFHETIGGKFGYVSTSLDTILFRTGNDTMDASPALFSGDKILDFPHGQESELRIVVQQDQPLPMTVLSIVSKMQVSDA